MRNVGNHIELDEEEAKQGRRGLHVFAILVISTAAAGLILGAFWVFAANWH